MDDDNADDNNIDDEIRRVRERRLLFAVVAGPLLLWFFTSGLYWTALSWVQMVSYYAAKHTVTLLAEVFFSLALLSAWRHPVLRKPLWPTFLVLTLAVVFKSVGQAVVKYVFIFSEFYWTEFDTYTIISQSLLLALSLVIFVLLRRFAGTCLIAISVSKPPKRSPLSIAELMYWTGAIAVALLIAKRLSWYIDALGAVVSPSLAMQMLILNLVASVAPTLILISTRGRLWIRLVIASACLLASWTMQAVAFASFYNAPVQFPDFAWASELIYKVLGPLLAIGWIYLRGDRFVRLMRTEPNPATTSDN